MLEVTQQPDMLYMSLLPFCIRVKYSSYTSVHKYNLKALQQFSSGIMKWPTVLRNIGYSYVSYLQKNLMVPEYVSVKELLTSGN